MNGGLSKITVEIGGKIAASLGQSLRAAQQQVSSFGRNTVRTMRDTATAGSREFKNLLRDDAFQLAAAGAAGIGIALTGSIRAASTFQGVLTDIGKTAGASGAELKGVTDEVLRLSGRNFTNLSATTLAQGVQDLVAQGLSLQDAVASMESLGRVATATNSDLLDVTKTGFQLQNALKIRPTELKATFDALAFAGKQGAFELRDMAQFMPTIAAAAGSLGIQGKQGAISLAAMMQMVRKDAPDAGQAATRLTDAMLKMTAPQTVKNFAKFGVNIEQVLKDAQRKGINPMEAALAELQRVTGGDAFKLGEIFGDKEAKLALMSLMKYRKEYAKLRDDAGGQTAAGTIDRDYQRQVQTFGASLQSFQNTAQRLGIVVGAALLPALTRLGEAVLPIAERIADFAQRFPGVTAVVAGLGAAFVGLVAVAPFVSSLISIVGALGAAIGAAGGAGAILGGVFAALTGPIGLTVLAIVGIGAALVAAYNRFGWFRNAVNGWAAGIKTVFAGIGQFIGNVWGLITGIFTGNTAKITSSFSGIITGLGALRQGIISAISAIPQAIGNVLRGIVTVAQLVFQQITNVFRQVAPYVVAAMFPIPALVLGVFGKLPPGIQGIFNGIVSFIQGIPGRLGTVGQRIIDAILNGLKAKAGELFGWIRGTWGKITGFFGGGGAPAPAGAGSPPGRALGGPVRAGMPYVVGERRRELFVPGMDGAIIPRIARPMSAAAMAAMLAAPVPAAAAPSAPVTVNAPITINAAGGDAMEIRRQVELAFVDIQREIESSHRVLLND
jgi:TP901 family phage tail tape measure protein